MNRILLKSKSAEKFLKVELVIDENRNVYKYTEDFHDNEAHTYQLNINEDLGAEQKKILNTLEEFIDTVFEHRNVFKDIDPELLQAKYTRLKGLFTANYKDDENKTDEKVIGALTTHSPDTVNPRVIYWTTNGPVLNNLPSGQHFMINKDLGVEITDAVTLTEICGGKEFDNTEDRKQMFAYLLSSHDRILTKYDICFFCKAELGDLITDVETKPADRVSPRPKEGIIRVIEIQLKPSPGNEKLYEKKGILRGLLNRLNNRSPMDYIYYIKVLDVASS